MNTVKEFGDFYISRLASHMGYGCDTTAIVSTNGLRNFYYVLCGDHSAALHKLGPEGWDACWNYWLANKEKHHTNSDTRECKPRNGYNPELAGSKINTWAVRNFFSGRSDKQGMTIVKNQGVITQLVVGNHCIVERALLSDIIKLTLPANMTNMHWNRMQGILRSLMVTLPPIDAVEFEIDLVTLEITGK